MKLTKEFKDIQIQYNDLEQLKRIKKISINQLKREILEIEAQQIHLQTNWNKEFRNINKSVESNISIHNIKK